MAKGSILLVDDDRPVLIALAANLKAVGYGVKMMDDGSKVAESIASDRPDLVILDVLMPETNGVEVLEAIRTIDAALPVIVCSGVAELAPFVEYSNISFFMKKPIDYGKLLGKVADILARV